MSAVALAALRETDRALLRACAAQSAAAEAGWTSWIAGQPAERQGSLLPHQHHQRELLPLLATRHTCFTRPAPLWLAQHFRTAALIEEQRLTAVRAVCAEILNSSVLQDADPLVIGGLALGETLYPTRHLRHTSSLQILLSGSTPVRRLRAALVQHGLVLRQAGWRSYRLSPLGSAHLAFKHPSGLKINIDIRSPSGLAFALTHGKLTAQAIGIHTAEGFRFRAPCLAHSFALLAATASAQLRSGALLWLVDATFALRQAGDFARVDWMTHGAGRRLMSLVRALDDPVQ